MWAVIGIVALLLLIGNVPELFRSSRRLFTNRQTNDNQSSARSSTGSSAPENSESAAVSELHFTPEQLKDYYAVYTTPDVRYLRTLFNAYLKGTAGHDSEFEILRGLSTDYYRSKFIVYSRSPGEFGGTQRPDFSGKTRQGLLRLGLSHWGWENGIEIIRTGREDYGPRHESDSNYVQDSLGRPTTRHVKDFARCNTDDTFNSRPLLRPPFSLRISNLLSSGCTHLSTFSNWRSASFRRHAREQCTGPAFQW